VYIIWALEGKFPSGRTGEDMEAIEEERRLFYVAATRAKEGLTILHPVNIFDRVSGSVLSTPTRFLDNVSHEIAPRYVIEEDGEDDDHWEDDDIIFW
jgi:DNA helicase-2/ATP-dependent DNA helicase PcrA